MRLLSPSVAILRTQSDERLVTLARDGHEAAFTAIVERYRRPMLAAARRFLPEARAEDAVQQTFVAAWRGLQRGDDVRELRPWLYRIARNTALNALRTPGYDVAELQESLRFAEAPQDELERREAIRRTLAGLAALPERQREALVRTAVEGDAHADVARDLGLSEGAARQLVMRARTTLRSAASAVLPFPLLQWLVAGGGTAGTLAKAGAVVVVAGTAVATPVVVVKDSTPRTSAAARPAATEPPPSPSAAPAPTASASPAAARTGVADDLVTGEPAADSRREQRRRRRGRDDDRDDSVARTPARQDNSGPGSVNSGSSGSDDRSGSNSGPGSTSSGSGSSGSGSDDLPEIDDDNSGSGSSGSGSGDDVDDDDLTDNSGSGSADDLPELDDDRDDDSSGSGSDHD